MEDSYRAEAPVHSPDMQRVGKLSRPAVGVAICEHKIELMLAPALLTVGDGLALARKR